MTNPAQASLSSEFEELWPLFEGNRVSKVIMTFAGEVDLSSDPELCAALGYLEEVEFTVMGRITGKKHSLKGNVTVGNATIAVERIRTGATIVTTKAGRRAAEAAQALNEPEEAEGPTPIKRRRGRRQPAVFDDLDADDRRAAMEAQRAADDAAWEEPAADDGDGSG